MPTGEGHFYVLQPRRSANVYGPFITETECVGFLEEWSWQQTATNRVWELPGQMTVTIRPIRNNLEVPFLDKDSLPRGEHREKNQYDLIGSFYEAHFQTI